MPWLIALAVRLSSSAALRKLLWRAAASKTRSELSGGSRKAMPPIRFNLASHYRAAPPAGQSAQRPMSRSRRVLINVGLVTAIDLQLAEEPHRLGRCAAAMLGDDVDERGLDVLGHAQRVAADIDVRAIIKPGPEVAANLAHAVLDVDLLVAVARPGKRQPREQPGRAHGHELIFVEEVVAAALMAEEQPVAPGRVDGLPLVQEGAERRDAGPRPDHDDRLRRILRQREMRRLLHIDPDPVARRNAIAEEGGADAETRAPVDLVAHRIDSERNAGGICLGGGGD